MPKPAAFLLPFVLAPLLPAFQAFSGSAEWISRRNTVHAAGLGASSLSGFQSALLLRARTNVSRGPVSISAAGQAYGTIYGYPAYKAQVDEAWASVEFAGHGSVLGGIQRYPHQYSYYWNPTFPLTPKTDLARPDYLAAGTPMLVVSSKAGPLTPRFIAAWDSGEPTYGLQIDAYARGIESYLNGFYSAEGARSAGAGTRIDLSGWTLQAEGSALSKSAHILLTPSESAARSPCVRPSGPRSVAWRTSVGVNRTVLGKGLLTAEVFHDGAGMSAPEFDAFQRLAVSGLLETVPDDFTLGALRRNYSFVAYHYTHSRKLKWGIRNVVCWDDASGYLQPVLTWVHGDHLEFGTELLINYSRERSEFGLLPARTSLSVRLRYYL